MKEVVAADVNNDKIKHFTEKSKKATFQGTKSSNQNVRTWSILGFFQSRDVVTAMLCYGAVFSLVTQHLLSEAGAKEY